MVVVAELLRTYTRTLYVYVQSVFNGMHVVFIPYSIMKIDPGSWMKMVTRYRGMSLSTIHV